MNDPHVESLRYQFISERPSDKYDDVAPLITSVDAFDIELRDGTLIVHPQKHYADPEAAKADFEPILDSWETSAVLHEGAYRIRFRYVTANVIERDPSPTDRTIVRLRAAAGAFSAAGKLTATLTRSMATYPAPDPSFRASTLTDKLVLRLERVYDDREPLPQMAFWMLDKLETHYGGGAKRARDVTAKRLVIDSDVLYKLGELTSDVADPEIGRKASGSKKRSYTGAELQWMRKVVVRLIQRIGELNAGGANLQKLTLGDFPPI